MTTYPLQIDNLPMLRKVVAANSPHLRGPVYEGSRMVSEPVPMFSIPESLDAHPETGEIVPGGFWIVCPSWTNQKERPVHYIRISHPFLGVDGEDIAVAAYCPCSCQDRTMRLKSSTTRGGEHCKHQEAFLNRVWPALCWHLLDSARRQISLQMEAA